MTSQHQLLRLIQEGHYNREEQLFITAQQHLVEHSLFINFWDTGCCETIQNMNYVLTTMGTMEQWTSSTIVGTNYYNLSIRY
jgi:hypothetical protein